MASTGTILDNWSTLVDPVTGIVREVTELALDDDAPTFVHYLSVAADTAAFGLLPNFGNNGGASASRRGALVKAIGEAVERYCSAIFDTDELLRCPYAALPGPGTPPESFALYTDRQLAQPGFPWSRFTADTIAAWVAGRSLVTGRVTYVPAPFVYVPFHFSREHGEAPITQPISTGLACGESPEQAALGGLCEVIERDAFTITWQSISSRPLIAVSSLPPEVGDLVARFTARGIEVHLVDISTDVACPVVLAVAEGHRHTSPAVAVAAAAHPRPQVAAVKSLEELAHTRRFAQQVLDYLPAPALDVDREHPEVDGQRAHLRCHCPQDAKHLSRFLWANSERIGLDEMRIPAEPTLGALVDEVARTGEDVIAVDLTSPDVASLGLAVMRVVVPGFHPLQMGHRNRCCGGRRLATVPVTWGRSPWSADADNPYPHPFP